MKTKTLNKLSEDNPNIPKGIIKIIISKHLMLIQRKVQLCEVLDLKIPLFGNIHTHRNSIDPKLRKNSIRISKFIKNKSDFSDKTLLF